MATLGGIIGSVIDGFAANVIGELSACVDGSGTEFFGQQNDFKLAASCFTSFSEDNHDCYCVTGNSSKCYFFDGQFSDSCQFIVSGYPSTVTAAFAADVAATAAAFCLGVMCCFILCCPYALDRVHNAVCCSPGRTDSTASVEQKVALMTSA